jgi:RNA polymerase sigma factor (sigma-70 family)
MQVFDDIKLIDLALDGSQAAYRMLYDKHVDSLFRFVQQFRQNRTDTADLVQQSFIKCFTKLHAFQQKSSFKTWLFGIAVREMQMDWRSWKDKTFEELNEDQLDPQDEENEMETAEIYKQVHQLDEQKKMVFLLFEVEGYSHKEIAELLDLKESHCRTVLTRAKNELRNRLKESNS